MRATPYLILGSILLLFVTLPTAAAAEEFNCHTWDVFVGDRQTGAGVSGDTATYTAAGGYYVVNDGVSWNWLFSIWFYEESNGEYGLQRGDEVCDESDGRGWPYSDGGCFC